MASVGAFINLLQQRERQRGDPNPSGELRYDQQGLKGRGFLGPLARPDGGVMTEYSIGVNIGGKEVEIPTLVPTLSEEEKQFVLRTNPGEPLPDSIVQKAVDHAKARIAGGASPFADFTESPKAKGAGTLRAFMEAPSPAEFIDRPAGLWPAEPAPREYVPPDTILPQQSELEPTLAPGQTADLRRIVDMLPGIIEAAGMAVVPGVGPRGPLEMRSPAARVRSAHEEQGTARGRGATIEDLMAATIRRQPRQSALEVLKPDAGPTLGDLATAESRLQSGQFVRAEDVPLNRNRYLAVYGEPDAKVRNRGGKPIEYAVQPQAEAVRLEREGKPYFVGRLTPEQWLEKQQSWVGPEGSKEWNEARGWYKNLLSEFTQVYGPEAAPAMLSLWGLSQQRASPSAGMSHVLKAQDIAAGWRSEMEGQAGLAHDRLMKAIRTGDSDVGEKLADFADAVRGKTTRQWTGDDPRTGQPAPFDVHASRDVGFIDDTTRSTLAKHFGPEVAARFPVDMKGAPSDGQYAYGSKYYNAIKDALNARLEPGQAPYTADEVQAIGWVGHQNMTGASPEGPGNIFQSESRGRSVANISRVAVEAAPGEGSPLLPMWEAIPEAKRAEATYRILNEHAGSIADTVGVKLRRAEPTVGVWQQYSNPNVTFEVVGTPDGALRFAQGMAYAAGQSEVWAHQSVIRDRANAFGMDIKAPESFDLTKPSEVTRFWTESGLAQVPGLGAAKIQAKDGDHRIRVIFDRDPGLSDAARQDGRDFDTLAAAAKQALEASPLEGWSYRAVPLGLRKSVHDWKGDASGQGHLRGLDRKPGAVAELDGIARRVAESFRREGAGQAAGAEPDAGLAPFPDSAQGLTLRQLAGQPPSGGSVVPLFEAAEVRRSSSGDWHLVDRRGNWDATKFPSREAAEKAQQGSEVPLSPVRFESAFAGRGVSREDMPVGEYSRFGPGRYWADNKRVAEIFAEHRDQGRVVSGTAGLEKPFDAAAPNVHSPEFRRLVSLLEGEGLTHPQIMRAVVEDPVDAFAGLTKAISGSRDTWKHAPKLNALLRRAGYDGILGTTRDSPDFPNHREIVEFNE